jgi:hypothetical protein
MNDLTTKINEFVDYLRVLFTDHHTAGKHVGDPPKVEVTFSDRWAKIAKRDGSSCSVYAFICLREGETKTLGLLRPGDIHFPASWKMPAKHARGSVFRKESWTCAGPYSIAYLK